MLTFKTCEIKKKSFSCSTVIHNLPMFRKPKKSLSLSQKIVWRKKYPTRSFYRFFFSFSFGLATNQLKHCANMSTCRVVIQKANQTRNQPNKHIYHTPHIDSSAGTLSRCFFLISTDKNTTVW